MTSAVLLYQYSYGGVVGDAKLAGPIFAYGKGPDGFHWARLNLTLWVVREQFVDGGFTLRSPTGFGSLSRGGEFAAFAQPDEIVVMTIRTGAVRHIPLPGMQFSVAWLADGRHLLVSGDGRNALLDVVSGAVIPSTVTRDVAIPAAAAEGMLSLTNPPNRAGGAPTLHYFDDRGQAEARSVLVDDSAAGQFKISHLRSNGFRYGNRIAVAAEGHTPVNPRHSRVPSQQCGLCCGSPTTGNFVTVIDTSTAAVTHILWLTDGFYFDVVGWLGPDTVLLRKYLSGLLAWNLDDGSVTQLVGGYGDGEQVAVAPQLPPPSRQAIQAGPVKIQGSDRAGGGWKFGLPAAAFVGKGESAPESMSSAATGWGTGVVSYLDCSGSRRIMTLISTPQRLTRPWSTKRSPPGGPRLKRGP